MKNKKKVKIVATLGPSSDSKEMMIKLVNAGVNVFRVNMSHLSTKEAQNLIRRIKSAEREVGHPIGILADLSGPKIRIGKVEKNRLLKEGEKINIYPKQVRKDKNSLYVNFPSIVKKITKGTTIFLGDGDIILEATHTSPSKVTAKVIAGGMLRSNMGFLPQDIPLGGAMITKKDKEDIKGLSKAGVTAFAVSFVQSKKEIKQVKKLIPSSEDVMVIAKIETPSAVDNAEEILEEADGIMVARGDLGLSLPMEKIPQIQKYLIELALRKAKPVITATQMLESMRNNPLPTRAEVSDVSTAVLEGTDAVMLSAETATGKYPLRVIEMINAVIMATEQDIIHRDFELEEGITEAIGASAMKVSDKVNARLTILLTESGKTARMIARHRHKNPIIALSPNLKTAHKLSFLWGVYPYLEKDVSVVNNIDDLLKETQKIAKNNSIRPLKKNDTYIISAGIPFGQGGSTNMLLVQKVK